jgi:hypothetical protein
MQLDVPSELDVVVLGAELVLTMLVSFTGSNVPERLISYRADVVGIWAERATTGIAVTIIPNTTFPGKRRIPILSLTFISSLRDLRVGVSDVRAIDRLKVHAMLIAYGALVVGIEVPSAAAGTTLMSAKRVFNTVLHLPCSLVGPPISRRPPVQPHLQRLGASASSGTLSSFIWMKGGSFRRRCAGQARARRRRGRTCWLNERSPNWISMTT